MNPDLSAFDYAAEFITTNQEGPVSLAVWIEARDARWGEAIDKSLKAGYLLGAEQYRKALERIAGSECAEDHDAEGVDCPAGIARNALREASK